MDFRKVINNGVALERQIKMILGYIDPGHIPGHNQYNFRCNVCGDSKKSKYKRRGYILTKDEPWRVYCHNCFYSKPVTLWMKEFFPLHFKDYISEVMRLNARDKEKKEQNVKNPTIRKPKRKSNERKHTQHFIHILEGKTALFAKAIGLCKRRRIPEQIWHKWFVATDGMYKNRLIIPFYDDKGMIYYYQGRALLEHMELKYLSRAGNHNSIYNYFHVDKEKPVVILEGPIDSIFVENSIAMTGVKLEDKLLDDFKHKYYLIDFDTTEETRKKVIELLEKGKHVFCWKWFMKKYSLPEKEKWDVNEAIIHLNRDKFTFEELKPFFTNSIYNKVYFI